jgi:hypothetical protein
MPTSPTPGSWEIGRERVGQILILEGARARTAERHDRCRLDLCVDRRLRQIHRQERGGGGDRGLHFLFTSSGSSRLNCSVMTDAPPELADDIGSPHLPELAFQRRGDRRRDHPRAGAGVERHDLDRRIVELGQRRQRQHAVRDDAHQQDRDHQQRSRHRPKNEQTRRIHRGARERLAFAAVVAEAGAPFTSASACTAARRALCTPFGGSERSERGGPFTR